MTPEQDIDWRERALRAEADLADVRSERARLWEELNQLRASDRREDHFYRLYRSLEDSWSWKLTKPLRSGKRHAGRVKRLLDERND
jgi:hypothetical protein